MSMYRTVERIAEEARDAADGVRRLRDAGASLEALDTAADEAAIQAGFALFAEGHFQARVDRVAQRPRDVNIAALEVEILKFDAAIQRWARGLLTHPSRFWADVARPSTQPVDALAVALGMNLADIAAVRRRLGLSA
jgi:hypothetical protein